MTEYHLMCLYDDDDGSFRINGQRPTGARESPYGIVVDSFPTEEEAWAAATPQLRQELMGDRWHVQSL